MKEHNLSVGSRIRARLYRNPGSELGWLHEIDPQRPRVEVGKSLAICLAFASMWLVLFLSIGLYYRRAYGTIRPFWDPATTLLKGPRFGLICLCVGIPISVVGVSAFAYALARDVSLPLDAPQYQLVNLSAGDWLGVAGLGLAFFAWGLSESDWSPPVKNLPRIVFAFGVLYLLIVCVPVTYHYAGPSIRSLLPFEVVARTDQVVQPIRRAIVNFSPSLAMANLAIAISLITLSQQINQLAQIAVVRSGRYSQREISLMRTRGAPEVLWLLSQGPATIEGLRQELPLKQSTGTIRKILSRLQDAGFVLAQRTSKEASVPSFVLTDRGRRLVVGLATLVD